MRRWRNVRGNYDISFSWSYINSRTLAVLVKGIVVTQI